MCLEQHIYVHVTSQLAQFTFHIHRGDCDTVSFFYAFLLNLRKMKLSLSPQLLDIYNKWPLCC